eukprot:5865826-Pyramimonas_sp.AAC.1
MSLPAFDRRKAFDSVGVSRHDIGSGTFRHSWDVPRAITKRHDRAALLRRDMGRQSATRR